MEAPVAHAPLILTFKKVGFPSPAGSRSATISICFVIRLISHQVLVSTCSPEHCPEIKSRSSCCFVKTPVIVLRGCFSKAFRDCKIHVLQHEKYE